jgi:AcrR family transcriptional regulator
MREQSRERLLDAALRLFSRQGYDRTSVRAIAVEAGVATGLLYHYFDGKESVLGALFERSMADVRASFAAADAIGAGSDAGVRIGALVRGAFEVVRRHQDFWRLSYAIRMQPPVLSALGGQLDMWIAEVLSRMERYLGATGVADAHADARALFAAIDGAAQHYVLQPDTYPVEEVAAAIARRFGASLRRIG